MTETVRAAGYRTQVKATADGPRASICKSSLAGLVIGKARVLRPCFS